MVLDIEVGLSSGGFVLDGDRDPSPKRGQSPSPIFGPCLLWPNGCTRVPLGTEVDLILGDIVLYGNPVPLP